jgi:hypothetical protein
MWNSGAKRLNISHHISYDKNYTSVPPKSVWRAKRQLSIYQVSWKRSTLVQNLKWTSTHIAWWPQAKVGLLSFREEKQTKEEGKKEKTSWANILTADQQARQYQARREVDVLSQTIIRQAPSPQHTALHFVTIQNETLSSTTGSCIDIDRKCF